MRMKVATWLPNIAVIFVVFIFILGPTLRLAAGALAGALEPAFASAH